MVQCGSTFVDRVKIIDCETGKGKEPEQDLSKKDDEKSDGKKKGFKGFMKKMFGKKDK